MKHIRWIWNFWKPHQRWLVGLIGMTLLSSAAATAYPMVFRYIIDTLQAAFEKAQPGISSGDTWKLVGILLVVGLARTMAKVYPGLRAWVNALLERDIRQHYFGEIISKGYKFFQEFRTGDLVTRLTDDIGNYPKISWFSCSGVFRAVDSASKFVFAMAFMLWMNWQLALLALIPLPIMMAIFYYLRIELHKRSEARQSVISKTNDQLEAAFSGVRILKAFNGEENQSDEFRELLDERIDTEIELQKLWFGLQKLYRAIQFTGQIIVIFAGGLMVIEGTLSIGELYAFYVYLSILLRPMLNIPQLFVASRQAFASIDREMEIEETSGGSEHVYTGDRDPGPVRSVELRDVSFSYEEDLKPALRGIDLEVSRGEQVAVVGSVGSGKSTLIQVVAGLLPPDSGQVLVNGEPLTDLDISAYRGRVGYIPQEATLFSESIQQNVEFGREVDDEWLEGSLELAQVLEEMRDAPDGLDTVLGQRGLKVSGGQKQRLAIARALAGEPDLLLMDDCTSALDAENEQAFWEDVRREFPDTAFLIVTHRISTAQEADQIYVLDGGTVAGSGSHDELLTTCPPYRNFLTEEELKASEAA